MARRLLTALILVAVVAAAGAIAAGLVPGLREAPAPPAMAPSTPDRTAAVPSVTAAAPVAPGAGFRSEARLREHHDKHGREFGRVTTAEYLALAQSLRDRPRGPRVVEATRPDGVITRFDRDSGAFLAFDSDGTIRTFFKPRDGEAYFRRQRDRAVP